MGISVAAQGKAMVQALLLGVAAGLLYDLFRILRVRIRWRFLGSILDLAFWLCVTVVLFLWSLDAWGGWIRIYGAVGLVVGGTIYFWLFSRVILYLGYRAADFVTVLCRLALLPLISTISLLKKIKNFAKNSFHYGRKWYKMNQITGEMAATGRRKAAREFGGEVAM